MGRNSQSPYTIFSGQKSHGDELVRNFNRRFLKATGNTSLEYLQRTRIESAKRSLESSRKTINEIMYGVGYIDVKSFRETFKRITGLTPVEYKHKFNKEEVEIF